MIKKILAHNFKGQSFEQELDQYNLFLGPNGAGKSSRTQALILSIIGYLPSDGRKKPGDIFSIHSDNGKPFTVGFVYNPPGTGLTSTFSRTFKSSAEGVITQEVAVNKNKLKREQIDKVLFQHGDPKIFDLPGFMDLSDQKKIDLIFTLFPSDADLSQIDEKLEALAGKEKQINADLKAVGLIIERMTKERSEINLPAGTLSELQAGITDKEKQLAETEDAIKEIEAQERAEKAKADAEAKAKEEAERVKSKAEDALKKAEEEKQKAVEQAKEEGRREAKAEAKITSQEGKREAVPVGEAVFRPGIVPKEAILCTREDVLADIAKIRETMERARCGSCAALIVVKSLLAKYNRRKEAA